jgi:tRNA A-37 threonylcarbamoyl transferase component Bud32/predicted nucleotidyltransferase
LRLTEAERSTITEVAHSLVEPSNVSAICAYGSKVAGYARPDSDYDVIVVSKRFREGVRYRYIDRPVPCSALIVDEHLLKEDAATSYLGEFVAGRFLNIYEPISNPELFRTVEVAYKRRVIMEALLELSSDYGEFGRQLIAPYDYFLFQKLSRRAAVYPPALYSYVQTYSCPLGGENRRISLEGFAAAAQSLAPKKFLSVGPQGVRLVSEKIRGDAFTKVQSIFSLTTRGVTQYAVHGYAGRVGLTVFRREAQSKLKRMRENPPPLPELERPRSLLKLEEGTVITDSSLLTPELARLLGFASFTTEEKDIGEVYSTTKVLTFRDGTREASVVVKNYSDVRSLKWALLGIWASAAKRFNMAPMARLEREYSMTAKLRDVGAMVPSILAVAPDERTMVKEFVSGPTLASIIDSFLKGSDEDLGPVSTYGVLVGRVHAAGMALGDAKASNVVVSKDALYLTDLEQALTGGDPAWDVAEFLYYTSKLSGREDAMRRVADVFLKGYSQTGDRAILAKARNLKYFLPFQPFLTPSMGRMLRESMAEFS